MNVKPYIYIYFFKRMLFYLDFNKFRFKKIKKVKILKLKKLNKKSTKLYFFKKLIISKKNASLLSLKKKFLKKSLYNNKLFNSRFFLKKNFKLKKSFKKVLKKKAIHSINKFFIKYIESERIFFLKMFGLKNKNQKSTTRFILNLYKLNSLKFKRFIEFSICNILIRSKLCLSKNHASTLLHLKLIYVNYAPLLSFSKILKKNDIIQIVFIKSFFFFYKYVYNLTFKRISKLNYCAWRIQQSKKRKDKQHIKSFPYWLNTIFFFPYAVPRYLEVDFSILSVIILKNPVSIKDYSPYIYWNFNYFFYKVMAWKWIT